MAVGDTILIKDILINGNNDLTNASDLSETLKDNTINAFGIDASSRTIWVNGQPYGNAYVNINEDNTIEAPIGAEIFNDFENNIASGKYSHAEGNSSKAKGASSHAEGISTNALGDGSHAEGKGIVSGNYIFSGPIDSDKRVYQVDHTAGLEIGDILIRESDNYAVYISTIDGNNITFNNTFGPINKQQLKKVTGSFGVFSHSEGNETIANEHAAHAEGFGTKAFGQNSHAEGEKSKSFGKDSHSEGSNTVAAGDNSHAEGALSTAGGPTSHAEGYKTQANSSQSHTEGYGTIIAGDIEVDGMWIGPTASHAEGYLTKVIAQGKEGGLIANGQAAHVEGYMTEAHNLGEHAEGRLNVSHYVTPQNASNPTEEELSQSTLHSVGMGFPDPTDPDNPKRGNRMNAHEIMQDGKHYIYGIGGYNGKNPENSKDIATILSTVDTSDTNKFIVEKDLEVIGNTYLRKTVTAGNYTSASGEYSHAEGNNTTASGWASHAEGTSTTASQSYSHSEGESTMASGWASHAEGQGNIHKKTEAKGSGSHAEGYKTTTFGICSHSEGHETEAIGNYSHVEGYNTETGGDYNSNTKIISNSVETGYCAHAEGNATIAQGAFSHAEGTLSFAKGVGSHAAGYGTEAHGNYSHTEGSYNVARGENSILQGHCLFDYELKFKPFMWLQYAEETIDDITGNVAANNIGCGYIQIIGGPLKLKTKQNDQDFYSTFYQVSGLFYYKDEYGVWRQILKKDNSDDPHIRYEYYIESNDFHKIIDSWNNYDSDDSDQINLTEPFYIYSTIIYDGSASSFSQTAYVKGCDWCYYKDPNDKFYNEYSRRIDTVSHYSSEFNKNDIDTLYNFFNDQFIKNRKPELSICNNLIVIGQYNKPKKNDIFEVGCGIGDLVNYEKRNAISVDTSGLTTIPELNSEKVTVSKDATNTEIESNILPDKSLVLLSTNTINDEINRLQLDTNDSPAKKCKSIICSDGILIGYSNTRYMYLTFNSNGDVLLVKQIKDENGNNTKYYAGLNWTEMT